MGFLKKKTISWDTELINGLMKVASVNEKSLKENIRILCLIIVYGDKKIKKKKQ